MHYDYFRRFTSSPCYISNPHTVICSRGATQYQPRDLCVRVMGSELKSVSLATSPHLGALVVQELWQVARSPPLGLDQALQRSMPSS